MSRRVFLYPFIQSHWSCFQSLIPEFHLQSYSIFLVHDGCQNPSLVQSFSSMQTELVAMISSKQDMNAMSIGQQDVLLVGNDSDPPTVKWIQYFRKNGAATIMLQDGWLVSENILRPIYRTPNLYLKLRWLVHYTLVRYTGLGRKLFHNFLCQNAQYFFLYSSYSKEQLYRAGVKNQHLYVTGSPKHSYLKEIDHEVEEGVWILFSTITFSVQDFQDTVDAINVLLNNEHCQKLLIKLHPDEDASKYADVHHPKLEWMNETFTEVMSKGKVQLAFCFASTVVLDLLMMNIPVIQIAIGGMDRRYTNYFYDLPLMTNSLQLDELISTYNLRATREIGSKYLLDLENEIDSRKNVLNVINQILS